MSNFTPEQTAQLLKPIAPKRVLQDAKGHSHVSQQDVTAHLIRMFGFGGFDTEVLSVECIFEQPTRSISKGKSEPDPNRYDVCYRALLRLTIRDTTGKVVCQYEDGSTATAQNQTRGDGHDLAYKSAISLAKKRAAINLGDQFGLSLYNKGQTSALVLGTLVGTDEAPEDLQADIPQQVSLGNDETEPDDVEPVRPVEPEPEPFDDAPLLAMLAEAHDPAQMAAASKAIAAANMPPAVRKRIRDAYTARVQELRKVPA